MRGRIAGVGVTALVLVAMLAALGAPAASAETCPNEAFRTGPSALLPECRAYEMVTPVDKESAFAVATTEGTSVVSPSGDGIFFYAPSAYGDAQGSPALNPYVAGRGVDGWDVTGASGPQGGGLYNNLSVLGISDDLGLSVVVSKDALAPGAIPFGSNVYLRDNPTDTYTTIAALPGNEAFAEWTNGSLPSALFVDADSDWSDILLSSRRALTPDAVAGMPNLYEYREGALRLAVAGGEPASVGQTIPNVMSADGGSFYYLQEGAIYLHRRGQEAPILASEKENGDRVSFPQFVGATPDGQVAFFFSYGESLYRFEAGAPAGGRVTDLTPAENSALAGVESAYVGEDGTVAYLTAQALLTPDAEPRPTGNGVDIYAWHGELGADGALRYIGKTEDLSDAVGFAVASVSPNGRFFAFQSRGEVTPDAVQDPAGSCRRYDNAPLEACLNAFLYSLDTNRVVCASCTGSLQTKDSRLGGGSLPPVGPQSLPLLDDGSVLFETASALVPRDVNGAVDVYRRRGDTTQLVSTGTDPSPSTYIGASADGSNLFFQTAQSLVGQDQDGISDLYDSRIGGGLPQGAQAASPSCILDDGCRVGATPTEPVQTPGSRSFDGAGNVAGTCGALRRKAAAARKRSRALTGRARRAEGARARSLRKKAGREAKVAHRLGRRAGSCEGGGR